MVEELMGKKLLDDWLDLMCRCDFECFVVGVLVIFGIVDVLDDFDCCVVFYCVGFFGKYVKMYVILGSFGLLLCLKDKLFLVEDCDNGKLVLDVFLLVV